MKSSTLVVKINCKEFGALLKRRNVTLEVLKGIHIKFCASNSGGDRRYDQQVLCARLSIANIDQMIV